MKNSLRVLVVDDDPIQHLLMTAVLMKIGVQHFFFATSAEEALDRLQEAEEPFHLVFTDLNMPPGMSGQDLVTRIRTDHSLRHLRVIMATSEDNPELRQFLDRHLVGYIRKDQLTQETVCLALCHQFGR